MKMWTKQERQKAQQQVTRLLTGCKYYKKTYRKNGNTQDIINAILSVEKTDNLGGKNIAHLFDKYNLQELAFVLWDFVKSSITYIEDRDAQNIKNADCLWAYGFGDCKSFSLFIGSVLRALNVPYGYRFVSFSNSKKPTHVYVICGNPNNPTIIDAVWSKPLEEKPFKSKIDYWMSEINMITGIDNGSTPVLHPAYIGSASGFFTEAELDAYADEGEELADALEEQADMHGIGGRRKKRRKARRRKRRERRKRRRAKIKAGFKKFGKKFLKVATWLPRKVMNGVILPALRPASMAFVYTFAKPQQIAKFPVKVQQKAAKQNKIKSFLLNKMGMKPHRFNKMVRGGFMKRYGMRPEVWIANRLKGATGANVSIDPITTAAIISALTMIIKKIIEMKKGGSEGLDIEGAVPNDGDFGSYQLDATRGVYMNDDGTMIPAGEMMDLQEGDADYYGEGDDDLIMGFSPMQIGLGAVGLGAAFLLLTD